MKAVVQRVKKSELWIDEKIYSKIEKGFLVLLGVTETDTEDDMKALADKIMRRFTCSIAIYIIRRLSSWKPSKLYCCS